jgi:hypothetical protein
VESGVSGILFDDERELPEAVVGLLRDENRRADARHARNCDVREGLVSKRRNGDAAVPHE